MPKEKAGAKEKPEMVKARLHVSLQGRIEVELTRERFNALIEKLDSGRASLEEDDYGIDWSEAVNDLTGEVEDVDEMGNRP